METIASPIFVIVALAASLGGVAALAGARAPSVGDVKRRLLYLLSAALVLSGFYLSGRGMGWDAGIPVSLAFIMLAGFGAALARSLGERGKAARPAPLRRSAVDEVRRADGVLSLRRSAMSLLTGFLFSVAALFSLSLLLPMEPAGRAALATVLWPIVWTGMTLWLFASGAVLRSHLLTLLAAFVLFGLAAISFLSGGEG